MQPTPIPYLFFRGDCAAALTHYADVFDAEAPEILTVAASPAGAMMPAEVQHLVMHGALKVGEGWIYGADDVMGETAAMAGSSLAISFPTVDKARAVFDGLAEGGTVRMPFKAEFFTPGMGALTDRFGIRWMVLTDDPKET
ncbi:MAG: VOC family protein [Limimaricola sp.]|uniref:VOC family protein n=1 Tax=Limimaricola sp. TaxID=2211665 RepID=UPI001DF750E2|nr:VOC family protein [Limimaricola sp.]MBI1416008.1 VOC family protein [Limimaricola sp.]